MKRGMSGVIVKGVAACLRVDARPVNVLCASDLCRIAAERLLYALDWQSQEVALLVNVTQTPDYPNHPMTAPSIASKIGCGEIMALDVPGGGAGYIHGIRVAASLLAAGQFDKALVCAGDALVCTLPDDCDPITANTTDSGTVTALLKSPFAAPISFHTGTVGAEFSVNITPGLGFRREMSPLSLVPQKSIQGGYLKEVDPHINITKLRQLAKHYIPKALENMFHDVPKGNIDRIFFTQIDSQLHHHLAREMGVEPPVWDLFDKYGNLESAGFPVSIVEYIRSKKEKVHERVALAGFGSGFTYGSMVFEISDLVTPEIAFV